MLKAMKDKLKLKKVPDYRTINRRFSKLYIPIRRNSNEPLVIAIYSSGIKVTNRGEWLREHYKKKRKGYIKLHIAVDVNKNKVLSVRVTDERRRDFTQMMQLIDGLKAEAVIADGAYDSREIFNYLSKLDIKPIIKVRDNSIAKAKGSFARKKTVIEYKKDPEKWKKDNNYSQKLQAESTFSSIKKDLANLLDA
jgi:hypothetical protein